VFYAHSGFDGAKPAEGQRRFVTSLDEFARLMEAGRKIVSSLEGANLGVAPHSLRAVTPDELARVVPLAGSGPVHIHAAEQTGEVEQCEAWSGARPVQWLLDHADVDSRWCLIHATHMDASEIGRLAATGAVAGFCPITEANLGDGISPAAPYIREKGYFGIGTDSNVLISVSEELRQLEYGQRLRERARNVIAREGVQSTGRVLFEGALLGGARATGQVAGIAAGASADFFSLDPEAASLVSRSGDAVLDSFVFAGDRAVIDRVWCAGRKVVEKGRHHERSTIETNYRRTIARLL
jgi:formiminoglutamate deiminase